MFKVFEVSGYLGFESGGISWWLGLEIVRFHLAEVTAGGPEELSGLCRSMSVIAILQQSTPLRDQ
jgi:hypothetical protein